MLNFRGHFCNLTLPRTSQQSSWTLVSPSPPFLLFHPEFFCSCGQLLVLYIKLLFFWTLCPAPAPGIHSARCCISRERARGAGPTNLIWQKMSHSCRQCAGSTQTKRLGELLTPKNKDEPPLLPTATHGPFHISNVDKLLQILFCDSSKLDWCHSRNVKYCFIFFIAPSLWSPRHYFIFTATREYKNLFPFKESVLLIHF